MILALAVAAALFAAQGVPADLSALLTEAGVTGTLVTWCRGQLRAGRPNGYAVAIASAAGAGRYLVVDGDAGAVELASYTGAPDLACYTPSEARTLDESIRSSATISGRITPTFSTVVVCAFVEDTSAVCWQFSPKARGFVKVGDWRT